MNLSVVMPVFNAEKYLKESIESILNQTYQDFEFLILNDCSTDDSKKICEKYKNKFNLEKGWTKIYGDTKKTCLITCGYLLHKCLKVAESKKIKDLEKSEQEKQLAIDELQGIKQVVDDNRNRIIQVEKQAEEALEIEKKGIVPSKKWKKDKGLNYWRSCSLRFSTHWSLC